MGTVTALEDATDRPAVRGFLHQPDAPDGRGLVLTHGAGSNAGAPLLVAVAEARPHGPPFPAAAAQDQAGLRRAVLVLRGSVPGKVFLGGHSYGGRQATMLAAEEPDLAAGLLLLSYPLHPPKRPADLRTAHFAQLSTPALFVHGTRDPFGSVEEMRAALELIAGPHELVAIEGAGHDLGGKGAAGRAAAAALAAWAR